MFGREISLMPWPITSLGSVTLYTDDPISDCETVVREVGCNTVDGRCQAAAAEVVNATQLGQAEQSNHAVSWPPPGGAVVAPTVLSHPGNGYTGSQDCFPCCRVRDCVLGRKTMALQICLFAVMILLSLPCVINTFHGVSHIPVWASFGFFNCQICILEMFVLILVGALEHNLSAFQQGVSR